MFFSSKWLYFAARPFSSLSKILAFLSFGVKAVNFAGTTSLAGAQNTSRHRTSVGISRSRPLALKNTMNGWKQSEFMQKLLLAIWKLPRGELFCNGFWMHGPSYQQTLSRILSDVVPWTSLWTVRTTMLFTVSRKASHVAQEEKCFVHS